MARMMSKQIFQPSNRGRLNAGLTLGMAAVWLLGCGGRAAAPSTLLSGDAAAVLPATEAVEAVLIGEILYRQSDFEGAAAAFERAVSAEGTDAYLAARIADATARASEKKPSNPEVPRFDAAAGLSETAHAAIRGGRQDAAIAALERTLRVDPGRAADRLALIELLLSVHRLAEARFQIDSLPSPEDTASAVTARGRLMLAAGMARDARALLYEFLGARAPEPGELRTLLAATECALGSPEAAAVLLSAGAAGTARTDTACEGLPVPAASRKEPK